MFGWGLTVLAGLGSFVTDPVGTVAGWTWDKVTEGIYEWLAHGLATLIEWVWEVLDRGTTPRLTDHWFANDLAGRVGALALAVTIAMMLASAIQMALAGQPEQLGDTLRQTVRAIAASAFTITVVDLMVKIVDEAAASVWQVGRHDLAEMVERLVKVITAGGPLASTFVGPLCLLLGFVGLLGLTVTMTIRSALIYLVAALAPLVWSSSILPLMRDSSRRLVHLLVALIVSKLAIVISLVVAVQLASHVGEPRPSIRPDLTGASAVGTLITGFACFLVAAISPLVLYRLMPTVESAAASSGVVSNWGRGALSFGQAAMMARTSGAAAAATRAVAGQQGVAGRQVQGLAAATPQSRTASASGSASTASGIARRAATSDSAGARLASPRPREAASGQPGQPSPSSGADLPPLPRPPATSVDQRSATDGSDER
jgi:hypothetical protein